MAACTTTYYEAGRSWQARVEEHNAARMARQAHLRRGSCTPEFIVLKSFDNSRLVKAPDPRRIRQIRQFAAAMIVLFTLTMLYGLQHFSAIESGYRVESEKQNLEQLREDNRQLRLSDAQLTEPGRIDRLAREQGLAEPQPGQIVQPAETGVSAPALAMATPQSTANSF